MIEQFSELLLPARAPSLQEAQRLYDEAVAAESRPDTAPADLRPLHQGSDV